MKIFQIIHKYGPYIPYFEKKYNIEKRSISYEEHRQILIKDRFYAAHILKPALDSEPGSFYTIWDYPGLQLKWAREKGWNETDLKKILYAQIEDFKPDIFYNCSPVKFKASEIRNILPQDLIKIAWFASPEKNDIDFSVYNSRFTNFPLDVRHKSETGYRADLFHPSFDPVMESYAKSTERPVDIFFYGQYLPLYFKQRNQLIDNLVELKKAENMNIKIALLYFPEYKSLLPSIFPARIRRRKKKVVFPPEAVRKNSVPPSFGLDLYQEISKSKIVFNAAVDFSGNYKVNMRNIEAMGCGAHMLSDDGIYPDGLQKGRDFSVFGDFDDFIKKARYFLNNIEESRQIALQGYNSVSRNYSKENQWKEFLKIVSDLV